MMTRVLAAFRLPAARRRRASARPAAPVQRRHARAALGCGFAVFAAASIGLSGVLETAKPEWRDPEYGHRLNQLRNWKRDAPDRPVVLFLGSSRTQMAIAPAAMGLPAGPTDPLVYNFGTIAGYQHVAILNLIRLRDAGMVPAAVAIELFPVALFNSNRADAHLLSWADRITDRDQRLLVPFTGDLPEVRARWVGARAFPWVRTRARLLSAWAPEWVPPARREDGQVARMDAYGFTPHGTESLTPEMAAVRRAGVRQRIFDRRRPAATVAPLVAELQCDIVRWCRAEGIEVAFYWAPTSPAFRAFYRPGELEAADRYGQQLAGELGVSVFAAADHMPESEFFDGHHLMRRGAETYSRWLADTHLKPWLASLKK